MEEYNPDMPLQSTPVPDLARSEQIHAVAVLPFAQHDVPGAVDRLDGDDGIYLNL